MKQVTNAIVYLHKKGIVHRDLKLENILVATTQENNGDPLYDVKLTDFGLSVNKGGVGSESMLQASCGTPVYMAPEVIQNHDYSQQCDNWSMGVILYALMSKEFPFVADKEDRLYELIKRGEVDFSKPIWKDISSAAKELIKKLLDVNPAHRCTANEVTLHHWMTGDPNKSIPSSVLVMMKKFAENPDLEDDENDENLPVAPATNNDNDADRPGSSEAHSSGSSDLPPPPINKVTKKTPAKTLNNNTPISRGATGFNNTSKVGQRKNFGSPRKIAPDHKSFPNSRQQQHSPTHTASSRARSAKSPIPNGHVSNSNRLSANHSDRNTSPGHHHHRAVSPKPPSSPLLTPRNATSADVRLNSANRTRKKKTSLSATTPKR